MAYNPFEMSAIKCVRDLKEYNLVDPKSLDKKGEPNYNPVLNVCRMVAIEPGSLQQRIEEDTFKPFVGASLSGGSHIRIDYSSSFDAYIARGRIAEINVA